MASKTVQRSMEHLKAQGYAVQIVERWNPFAKVRQDLFGWIDIVGVRMGSAILGVQTTTGEHSSSRIDKARGNEALKAWLDGGGTLVVHSWDKRGDRGKRKVWTVVERWVTPAELEGVPQLPENQPKPKKAREKAPVEG